MGSLRITLRIPQALHQHIISIGTLTTGSQALMILGLAALKRDLKALTLDIGMLSVSGDIDATDIKEILNRLAHQWDAIDYDDLSARLERPNYYTPSQWRALCEHYGNRCLACGQQRPLTPDHVIPIAQGGDVSIDNIQPLCLECNQQKGARIIDYRTSYQKGE